MPPRIIFLRHGETDWNVEFRLQGQKDEPLNARGRDQARAVGRTLRDFFAEQKLDEAQFDFIASPLCRARETMELARGSMGLNPSSYALDPRLVELSFGRWEGLTWSELTAIDPWAAKARQGDKWSFQPPGGESYAMLAERVRPWLESLTRESFVVAHGGVARVLMAMIGGISTAKAPVEDVKQGRAMIFENGDCWWI
jgi:broad specificity phosphatase PhoE